MVDAFADDPVQESTEPPCVDAPVVFRRGLLAGQPANDTTRPAPPAFVNADITAA
jgi:hypothetical protein